MDLITIAKVAKTRGLRGEVIAELLTDFPERFDGLVDVTGTFEDGRQVDLKIERHFFQKNRIVLKFTGYDTIEQGEDLRGIEISVPESEAVELDTDEFFDWQLEGCRVETIGGETIGTVRELLRTGGTEVLIVAGTEKEFLIPFAESICVEVDVDNKLIRIDPPDGLLEF
ncbi:MAG: ribosome maturation factor RimM [Pyrinomonadaceae bacterium]